MGGPASQRLHASALGMGHVVEVDGCLIGQPRTHPLKGEMRTASGEGAAHVHAASATSSAWHDIPVQDASTSTGMHTPN